MFGATTMLRTLCGWATLVSLLVLAAGGCQRYGGLKRLVHLRAQAEFQCGEAETSVETVTNNTYRAHGCGKSEFYQCHRWDRKCANLTGLARDRARIEFSCPGDQITVIELSTFIFQVRGCGQKANYKCAMRGGVANCTTELGGSP